MTKLNGVSQIYICMHFTVSLVFLRRGISESFIHCSHHLCLKLSEACYLEVCCLWLLKWEKHLALWSISHTVCWCSQMLAITAGSTKVCEMYVTYRGYLKGIPCFPGKQSIFNQFFMLYFILGNDNFWASAWNYILLHCDSLYNKRWWSTQQAQTRVYCWCR